MLVVLLPGSWSRRCNFATALQAVFVREVTRESMAEASSIAKHGAAPSRRASACAFGAYALQISSLAQGGTPDIVTRRFRAGLRRGGLLSGGVALLPRRAAARGGRGSVGTRQGQVAAGRPAQADRNVALTGDAAARSEVPRGDRASVDSAIRRAT